MRAENVVMRVAQVAISSIEVTVLIPTYNGATTLDEQLAALAEQSFDGSFEVLISDNGSTDDTRAVACRWADHFEAFTIVDSSQSKGVAHSRNEGARAALGQKVLICDADDIVSRHWVRQIVEALDAHDVVGAAARPFTGAFKPSDADEAGDQGQLNRIFAFLPYALGGSMGVRREVLLAIGGFDRSYTQGHEEADFGWRAQLAGYSIGWCEGAHTNYRQKGTLREVVRQNYYFAKSSILLWCRYSGEHDLAPVSLKASVRRAFVRSLQSPRLVMREKRISSGRELGWSVGLLAGHVYYRVLGKVPAPDQMSRKDAHQEGGRG